nr:DUF5624 domain-containing protein [Legionella tunisiensis]
MHSLIIRILCLVLCVFNVNAIGFAKNTSDTISTASSNANNNTLAKGYVTPQAFWDLYYDFTGNSDPAYPKGKINISQTLFQSEAQQNSSLVQQNKGSLIMFINSTLYIYDSDRKLVLKQLMRTSPNSGFTEMTAISHIGPALMYLAKN